MRDERVSADISIPSDLAKAHSLQNRIETALQAYGYTDHDVFAIELAIEEALVDAVKHGNGMDPDKRINVRYQITAERCSIRISTEDPDRPPVELFFSS